MNPDGLHSINDMNSQPFDDIEFGDSNNIKGTLYGGKDRRIQKYRTVKLSKKGLKQKM